MTNAHSPTDPLNVNQYEKERRAWKYEGYPAYSKWQASDFDFWIFRRFRALNSRLLLWRQDRIVLLESKLEQIDLAVMRSGFDVGQNDSFRLDANARSKIGALPNPDNLTNLYSERHKIMEELWRETEVYCKTHLPFLVGGLLTGCSDKYINQSSAIQSWPEAEKRVVKNNRNWLDNHLNAIDYDERKFVTLKEKEKDLVAMAQRPRPPLERLLRRVKFLQYLFFEKPAIGHHVQSVSTRYFDDRKFQTMSNVLTVLTCMVILLGTIVALNLFISKVRSKEITIGTAAVALAGILAWATEKKAFDVVTSMAT